MNIWWANNLLAQSFPEETLIKKRLDAGGKRQLKFLWIVTIGKNNNNSISKERKVHQLL